MRQRLFRDAAEQKTANDVNHESAIGETGACAFLHQALQSVPSQRPRRSKHNQQS